MNPMENMDTRQWTGSEVAVIGMACRFPKSKNVEAFWANLENGANCITFFNDDELERSEVDPAALDHPDYVKAGAVLEDVELFDASFFGIAPNEALVMDPQHRLFLQCAWSALEDAGYNPENHDGLTGVFAGARSSSYLFNIYSNPEIAKSIGTFEIGLGNDLAFLSTRVSYKLNLRGPSFSIHSACSTSLVAVHQACQSLLNDECQMALAGGVAVNVPHKTGYLYRQGSIFSPDGHCRVFDEKAQGTIFGSGVGVIVLKRLEDAFRDRDFVHAVILGSAINNDGASKASFSAPSVQGQAKVILEALASAGVEPETISYVEAHGTGTPIGDPIELKALTNAFRMHTGRNGFCGIGSVKSNLGHLDAAAGIASMIKTMVSLRHKVMTPSIDFSRANSRIDFENTPFYVNTKLKEWKTDGPPRRAGVSAFGVGGTNAHVILEEAPAAWKRNSPKGSLKLLLWSARSEAALDEMTRNLGRYLQQHKELDLRDVSYTLRVGRKTFPQRRFMVSRTLEEAAEAMITIDGERLYTAEQELQNRPVVFLFPGQGAQYEGMGKGLYEDCGIFRLEIDRCSRALQEELSLSLPEILYGKGSSADQLQQTWLTQPALFAVEYALARQWMAWGVKPAAMVGHSLGEYVAACVAGVFTMQEGLKLVAARGSLMQELRPGSMLAVGLDESSALQWTGDCVWLAAVNGPLQCVLSGEKNALEKVAGKLAETKVNCKWLSTSYAFHSGMMEPMLERFKQEVKKVNLKVPQIPFLSNVTGSWISTEEAQDPEYWVRHVCETVRFGDGIHELLRDPQRIFLEVGPGQTLGSLTNANAKRPHVPLVLASLRSLAGIQDELSFIMKALGRLWLSGAALDGKDFDDDDLCHRVSLPTYPFEGKRYWLEPKLGTLTSPTSKLTTGKKSDVEEWFHLQAWKRTLPAKPKSAQALSHPYLIFSDGSQLASEVVESLRRAGDCVLTVQQDASFQRKNESSFSINPAKPEDYQTLLKELSSHAALRVVHLWSISGPVEQLQGNELFKATQIRGYYSLLFLSQAMINSGHSGQIHVVTDRLHAVETGDQFMPEKQTMLAVCKVIPQETPKIAFRCVDLGCIATLPDMKAAAGFVLAEMSASPHETSMVAYRGRHRFVQRFEPVRLNTNCRRLRELKEKGVYVITGGFGSVASILAEHLAHTFHARLVLISRTPLPERDYWPEYLRNNPEDDETHRRIRHVRMLEELGAQVMVTGLNLADPQQLNACLNAVQSRYDRIDGVFHTAGVTSGESLYHSFRELGPPESEIQFGPKVYGVYALRDALQNRGETFCMVFSSTASILGGLGYLTYTAANSFMDSFSQIGLTGGTEWISVNWDPWPQETKKYNDVRTDIDQYAMTRAESIDALERILAFFPSGQVVVATGDLEKRLDIWVKHQGDSPAEHSSKRPNLHTRYVAPSDEVEKKIALLWERLLGVEQIGTKDSFFDLGGHSLLATRLISQLRDEFSCSVPINEFFAAPTVADVAELIRGEENQSQDSERAALLDLLGQLSDEEVDLELKKRAIV